MGARLGATASSPLRAPKTSGRSAGRGAQQYATGTAALGPSGGVGPAPQVPPLRGKCGRLFRPLGRAGPLLPLAYVLPKGSIHLYPPVCHDQQLLLFAALALGGLMAPAPAAVCLAPQRQALPRLPGASGLPSAALQSLPPSLPPDSLGATRSAALRALCHRQTLGTPPTPPHNLPTSLPAQSRPHPSPQPGGRETAGATGLPHISRPRRTANPARPTPPERRLQDVHIHIEVPLSYLDA